MYVCPNISILYQNGIFSDSFLGLFLRLDGSTVQYNPVEYLDSPQKNHFLSQIRNNYL
jgi:hypothetical protein